MVCLNENIRFNKIKLKNNIPKEINKMIKLEFNYLIEEKMLEKIYKRINEKSEEMFSDNYFLYLNMDKTVCVHMFKKGKKEGYFCQKKIRTNLPENSGNDYLCCSHSKKHIPRKRKNTKNFLKISENPEFLKFREDHNKEKNFHKIYNKKNKINKSKKKKLKRIIVCNYGTIDFSKILKNIF